jgi:(2S)-methylsuccinyl-CoA dehydrogenase
MEGFSMSRLQTAARAVGVMQGALADAVARVKERVVFGRRLADYQLPLATIGRMAMRVNSGRQLARHASRMREGTAALDCTLAKLYAARMAELVTRDAVQLHGGLGYSEELDVSRQFVDARLLPIFEGTDEVLALRVVARALLRGSDRDD